MRTVVILLGLLCLLAPRLVRGLEPDKAFHHHVRQTWSIEQGLPQITVAAITQDRAGYLWVGTQAGVARFDGVRFTSFTPDNEPALPAVWIRALHAARDGRVWIGTYKGVAVHDGRRFAAVPTIDPQRWPGIDVYAFAEDGRGTLWIAAAEGVFLLRGGRLWPVETSPRPAHALWWRPDGLWVGARGEVRRRDPVGRWRAYPLPAAAANAAVQRLLHAQGRMWAATALGLYSLGEDGQWHEFTAVPSLRNAPIELLYADRDGNVWAGGDMGLARIRHGRLAEFVPARGAGGIPGLRSAFEDREGNLWFGSQWLGLVRTGDAWTRRFSTAEGLHEPIVWSVTPDARGRVWVGTNDGLALFEDGRFRLVVRGDQLPHPHAYNLLAEHDRLWIGTRRGVAVLALDGDRIGALSRPAELRTLDGAQVHGFVRDAEGGLWIPTSEGVFRLHGGHVRRFGEADGLADSRAMHLLRTRNDRVLVGSRTGVYEWRGSRFAALGGSGERPTDITSLYELPDGRLVVGSLSERLFLTDGKRWIRLGPEQGMPANPAFFITELGGYLWTAGLRGIVRVPLADLDAIGLGRSERVRGEMVLNERGDPRSGQQGYCCNGAGTAKGFQRNGQLWLPSRDGVVALDPRDIVKNTVAPQAVIERVQQGDSWMPAATVADAALPADARDLGFEFTVLSLQDPESVTLQYRLRGYDRAWRQADPTNRSTRYTNLPPGDYVFEVAGANNTGLSAQPTALAFTIRPYLHETRAFAAVIVLLLGALAYAGYRYQQHRHRKQRIALEGVVRQRTQALEEAKQRLEDVSRTDPLTGLRNRRYVTDQIPADLAYYDRQLALGVHQDEVMVIALVDIDHFKAVNDHFGHRSGDMVLQQFAEILAAQVRSGDYVARWGGEEFLLVFRPMPRDHLRVIGRRLRNAVNGHDFAVANGDTIQLTCSIGFAEYPLFRDVRAHFNWEALVELADQALYFVKSRGRDGWAAFRPTERTDLRTVLADIHSELSKLLVDGRLKAVGEIRGARIPALAPAHQ
ncbi:MAG TPA: diguanylate cyclase [Lysobacter sp.]|nr:diguanylate cyclase [Lysobacter sp.]